MVAAGCSLAIKNVSHVYNGYRSLKLWISKPVFTTLKRQKSMAKKRFYQTTSLLIYQLAKKLKRVHHHQKD